MTDADAPSTELGVSFEDAPCGLAQTTANGTFLQVNRTFCGWLGYRPEDLVGKRRLQELLTMGGRIFHQTHWAPLLEMQGSISEVKLELMPVTGPSIPMVLNAVRRRNAQQQLVHDVAAFVARDRDAYERELVLSRKRLETLVAEANRLHAEARDRAVAAEMMIGIVSHDLRNPLSNIQMGASLLGKSLAPGQQRTLDRMTRAVTRAQGLIADLLDFTQARLGTGLRIAREPLELHDAVATTVDELQLAHPGRRLIHARWGDGACSADADRLAQAIGNLVSNAHTYGSPESPVTVTSTISAGSFSVAVHNFGKAIPLAAQSAIFQPMSRGTQISDASRSVGLGLFIVSEIAKAHGGEAKVDSSEQAGTTFTIVCPR